MLMGYDIVIHIRFLQEGDTGVIRHDEIAGDIPMHITFESGYCLGRKEMYADNYINVVFFNMIV